MSLPPLHPQDPLTSSSALLCVCTPMCAQPDAHEPPSPTSKRRKVEATHAKRLFHHSLVQTDEAGIEYVMVHAVCLDHLHESGNGALPWQQSVDFVESLLAPAAKPPRMLAVEWQPGDCAIWDNRTTQHSVTPTHRNNQDEGYSVLCPCLRVCVHACVHAPVPLLEVI